MIGGSKVVSSKGLEGYEMFDPRDSRREDREECLGNEGPSERFVEESE